MISPGTKIVCPDCHTHVATAIEPIDLQDEVYQDQFEWRFKGAIMKESICPMCGAYWGDSGGHIHTDRGWQS